MAISVLGKRARGADLPTRRTRRLTRSFQNGNDENQEPVEEVPESDLEGESENEEAAVFSPAVTRTPSARRTKSIYKLEAIDYREWTQRSSLFLSIQSSD